PSPEAGPGRQAAAEESEPRAEPDRVTLYPVADTDRAPEPAAQAAPAGAATAGAGKPGEAGAPANGGAAASFLQGPARRRRIVYVIDRWVSMGISGGLDAARRELLASLAHLPEAARFQVILYNRAAEPLHLDGSSDLLPATGPVKLAAAR